MEDDIETQQPPDDPLGLEALWALVEQERIVPSSDPIVGTMIGGVTVVRLIAEGGMGRVYEGQQESPRRTVAIKLLRPGPAGRAAVRRFLNEAQILGQLRHPWICQVHAAGMFDCGGTQLPYFVMEYIPDGLTITDHARRRALAYAETLELFAKVCDAIGYAHARGVVHRDLKPGNILVDAGGEPRVIDFGIAKGDPTGVPCPPDTTTASGSLLGTIQYMSPEQIDRSSSVVDARADVYALGVMLHELVSGAPPYVLTGLPMLEALRVIHESKPSLVRVRGVPAGVSIVIDHCLQKNPRRRYPDATALATDLRAAMGSGSPAIADRLRLWARGSGGAGRLPMATAIWAALLAAIAVVAVSMLPPGSLTGLVPGIAGMQGGAQPVDVPPPGQATLSFRHAFTSVLDAEADRYLTHAEHVTKWNDPSEELRVNYWGPAGNGVEGQLVYRFPFPGRSARISIESTVSCWDFQKHPGGFGRGACAIEASRDGTAWISLRDDIGAGRWGADCILSGDLPPDVLGTTELWLRIRLLAMDVHPRSGYTVAQFGRAIPGTGRAVFVIEADCAPSPSE